MYVRLSHAVVGCCCSLSSYHNSVLILVKMPFLIDPQFSKKNGFLHSELLLHIRCFRNGCNYFVLLPGSTLLIGVGGFSLEGE